MLGDKIAKSHVVLVATLDGIGRDIGELRGLDAASRVTACAAIARKAVAFVADMREHLTEEEDTVIPAAVNHLDAKLERKLTDEIVKHLKLSDVPAELGWVLHSANDVFREAFVAKLPGPLRWHLPKVR